MMLHGNRIHGDVLNLVESWLFVDCSPMRLWNFDADAFLSDTAGWQGRLLREPLIFIGRECDCWNDAAWKSCLWRSRTLKRTLKNKE